MIYKFNQVGIFGIDPQFNVTMEDANGTLLISVNSLTHNLFFPCDIIAEVNGTEYLIKPSSDAYWNGPYIKTIRVQGLINACVYVPNTGSEFLSQYGKENGCYFEGIVASQVVKPDRPPLKAGVSTTSSGSGTGGGIWGLIAGAVIGALVTGAVSAGVDYASDKYISSRTAIITYKNKSGGTDLKSGDEVELTVTIDAPQLTKQHYPTLSVSNNAGYDFTIGNNYSSVTTDSTNIYLKTTWTIPTYDQSSDFYKPFTTSTTTIDINFAASGAISTATSATVFVPFKEAKKTGKVAYIDDGDITITDTIQYIDSSQYDNTNVFAANKPVTITIPCVFGSTTLENIQKIILRGGTPDEINIFTDKLIRAGNNIVCNNVFLPALQEPADLTVVLQDFRPSYYDTKEFGTHYVIKDDRFIIENSLTRTLLKSKTQIELYANITYPTDLKNISGFQYENEPSYAIYFSETKPIETNYGYQLYQEEDIPSTFVKQQDGSNYALGTMYYKDEEYINLTLDLEGAYYITIVYQDLLKRNGMATQVMTFMLTNQDIAIHFSSNGKSLGIGQRCDEVNTNQLQIGWETLHNKSVEIKLTNITITIDDDNTAPYVKLETTDGSKHTLTFGADGLKYDGKEVATINNS